MERREMLAKMETRETQATWDFLDYPDPRVQLERMVHQDLVDQLERGVTTVPVDNQDQQERTDPVAHVVPPAPVDPVEKMEEGDPPVFPEIQDPPDPQERACTAVL